MDLLGQKRGSRARGQVHRQTEDQDLVGYDREEIEAGGEGEDDGDVVGAEGELTPNRSQKGVRWEDETPKMTLEETIQLDSASEASASETNQGKRLQISP